jgi:hypothetical protein
MTIIKDFKGRELTLLSTKARKTNGHRYLTRKSLADVVLGLATRVRGGSMADNPVNGWPAKVTKSRIRIGCHIFTGRNAQVLREWALSPIGHQ